MGCRGLADIERPVWGQLGLDAIDVPIRKCRARRERMPAWPLDDAQPEPPGDIDDAGDPGRIDQVAAVQEHGLQSVDDRQQIEHFLAGFDSIEFLPDARLDGAELLQRIA